MEQTFKKFEELSPRELEQIFRLRQQVFVIEQTCFYEDIDGEDGKAEHLCFYDNGKLTAYLRIFQPGVKYKEEASLGRIIVAPEFRGTGLGPKLIKEGIQRSKGKAIRIEAQAALRSYYEKLGFEGEGEIYIVDGIDHLQMTLTKQ